MILRMEARISSIDGSRCAPACPMITLRYSRRQAHANRRITLTV
jgi:hypothetical protein